MENKILFVCAICTKSAPPLICLNAERKNILAAVTSVLHLREMFLLMCGECNQLLDAVIKFKKIAVTGIHNLLLLKEKVKNSSNAISSKPMQNLIILQSKTQTVKNNSLPSISILNSIPEDSVTSKQESTVAVDIKTEPESHISQYTSCATSADLTEEIHIKEEPEFETEPQLDFEIEPEEFKPDIHVDLIASNLYSEADNNTDSQQQSVGTSNIESKTDQFEANIKIKSEPECDESTDTCESDYGNEEDIILAALVKANAPTLAYLKGKDIESPSRNKTSKDKPSRKRRRPKKRLTQQKQHYCRVSEEKRKYYVWNETSMKNAIEAVRNGNVGLNDASRLYGVPKATLKRRLDGTNQKAKDAVQIVGSEGDIPPELEKELCERVLEMEKKMFGATPLDVRRLAFDLAEKNNIKHRFNKEERMAGKKWYYSFVKRHPQLSLRQPRATAMNR